MFCCQLIQAADFTYMIGGVTPHIQRPTGYGAVPLCNELSEGTGVIYNEVNSFRFKEGSWSTGAIVGENSYCQPIWGATQSYQIIGKNRLDISATVGFYHFEEESFDFSEGAYFSNIGDFYFVPIAGVEVNYTLYKSKSFNIKTMNLITPVITHHSVGIQFDI